MRLRETNMNFVRISDSDFDLDTISWVTPRLAVTDVNGALDMHEESDCYIINVAREIDSPCDYKLPVAPFIHGPEEVRAALDTLADVIHDQLEGTDNRVVVHCFALFCWDGEKRAHLRVVPVRAPGHEYGRGLRDRAGGAPGGAGQAGMGEGIKA